MTTSARLCGKASANNGVIGRKVVSGRASDITYQRPTQRALISRGMAFKDLNSVRDSVGHVEKKQWLPWPGLEHAAAFPALVLADFEIGFSLALTIEIW